MVKFHSASQLIHNGDDWGFKPSADQSRLVKPAGLLFIIAQEHVSLYKTSANELPIFLACFPNYAPALCKHLVLKL